MRINIKIANTSQHVAPLLHKEEVRQKLRDAIESRDPENLRQRDTKGDMVRHGVRHNARGTYGTYWNILEHIGTYSCVVCTHVNEECTFRYFSGGFAHTLSVSCGVGCPESAIVLWLHTVDGRWATCQ